jgi:GTPase SAR1 family protein
LQAEQILEDTLSLLPISQLQQKEEDPTAWQNFNQTHAKAFLLFAEINQKLKKAKKALSYLELAEKIGGVDVAQLTLIKIEILFDLEEKESALKEANKLMAIYEKNKDQQSINNLQA